MKTRFTLGSKIICLSLILGLFLFTNAFVRAAVELNLDADYSNDIWELNEQINEKRKAIDDLNYQAELYQKSLASKRREIASLNYQVSTINQTVTKISLEKEALELKIEEINLQVQNTQLKIQATEDSMAKQKDQMAILIRTLFQSDKENNLLAILATSDNLGDYFSQLHNLESLQNELFRGLGHLDSLKIALVREQNDLDSSKVEIKQIQEELGLKTESLENQKSVKYTLINETRGEEGKYQELLQELKAEQEQINNDIVYLEQVAREKLNRQLQESGQLGSGPMIWPVPSKIITSYFHDPDYPYRNIFEHPAIDIRASQGTAVQAASSGYIARAKNSGLGYSYIMIVHDDGLSTVYGHVSSINVSEGNFVSQGQIIGLSGGAPGTAGAGRLTTGPHLHFEVRLNGIPVNPLNYLP
jgi:murein DD-endopeptidase MepM/ murein hydrolase activator NlpD